MILVTGATGTIGREVVAELRRLGTPFRIAVRSPEKTAAADAVTFDFSRPETFGPALAGVDTVFLLSPPGQNEIEAPLIDATKASGVRRIVRLSVWGAEKEAFVFSRPHRAMEKRVEASGVAWTFLRPNGFMQNYRNMHAESIRTRGEFIIPAGASRHSIIDARDVGAVAARTLSEAGHEGKAYALTGPEPLSNAEIAEKISKAIGKPVRYVDMPEPDYKKMMVGFGFPGPFVDGFIDLQRYYRSGAGEAVTPEVERLLGRPPISFDRFARDNAAAWK
jgi:uncharacterized protein YbjT (DUF2867 family)